MKGLPLLKRASVPAIALLLGLGLAGPVVAEEDLSDNATCLECHADEPRGASRNTDRPQVHTEDGGFNVEFHADWSCIDCHDMVTEIPHPEGMDGHAVECTNCHDSTPTME